MPDENLETWDAWLWERLDMRTYELVPVPLPEALQSAFNRRS